MPITRQQIQRKIETLKQLREETKEKVKDPKIELTNVNPPLGVDHFINFCVENDKYIHYNRKLKEIEEIEKELKNENVSFD